ncbi:MAG TPA: thioredoxin family protein [Lachnospiraceae bacterium]|nr:thioredoxin family protein [Lachnospiraceae bacterium]
MSDLSTLNSKMKWIRIGIVLLIVTVIAGVFVLKSLQNKDKDKNEPNDTFPLKISETNIDEIKLYGVPTVIDFGSDSCIPCKKMAPVLETLNKEWQDRAAVQFMDVWKYSDGVEDFPITVIPTQVFLNADGTPFVPSEELASQIEFTMYADKISNEHAFTVHQGGITENQMRMIFSEMGVE